MNNKRETINERGKLKMMMEMIGGMEGESRENRGRIGGQRRTVRFCWIWWRRMMEYGGSV